MQEGCIGWWKGFYIMRLAIGSLEDPIEVEET